MGVKYPEARFKSKGNHRGALDQFQYGPLKEEKVEILVVLATLIAVLNFIGVLLLTNIYFSVRRETVKGG